MLVKNDFLSHWKTRLLCKRIGDGPALRALLSLWSYCEQRRAWQFSLTPLEIAGVCDFGGDHVKLYGDLTELRFIVEVETGWWEVNGWGELNTALVHKWPGRKLHDGEFYHPQGRVAQRIAEPTPAPTPEPIAEPIPRAIGLDRIGLDWKEPPLSPKGDEAAASAEISSPDSGKVDPTVSETEIPAGKKKKRAARAVDSRAEAIYAVYPRKVGRDAALRAISKRLAEDMDADKLLAATQGFAAAVKRWPLADRNFIPHPATWFNQGRFADDPIEWQRTADKLPFRSSGPTLETAFPSAPSCVTAHPSAAPAGYERAWAAFMGPAIPPPPWPAIDEAMQGRCRQWLADGQKKKGAAES